MPTPKLTPVERFFAKTKVVGDCLIYTGRIKNGYGIFRYRDGGGINGPRHEVGAHRFALSHYLGRPIAPGMMALHGPCDTPNCVKEGHLYEGTHGQNMYDMRRRNRQPHKKTRETDHEDQQSGRELEAPARRAGCSLCGCECRTGGGS